MPDNAQFRLLWGSKDHALAAKFVTDSYEVVGMYRSSSRSVTNGVMLTATPPVDSRTNVVVTRDGNRWLAQVPEYPGTQVSARTFPGLDQAVRDAIVLAENLPDEQAATLALHYAYRLA
jgi:hypothetical protein